jgi:GNAT superfamily N-acetyltransferase
MISIRKATIQDALLIRDIAYKTWPETYKNIVSKSQLDYMLELFYNQKVLIETISKKNNSFLLAFDDNKCLGFAAIEHFYLGKEITRLNKLYILPESQGKGIGKFLIEEIMFLAKAKKSNTIHLNVNRFNKAHFFYTKMGFIITSEVNIELDFGYLMEDYIMEKVLD